MEGLAPGTVIGGEFVVVRPLDEGGMGAVYVATQTSTGKERALKVMHREIASDPALQRRFEQEAKIGARIPSEHVVDVVAAGVDAELELPFLVMELLVGEDLRHRLRTRGAMSLEEVRAIFEQACHALAAAHAASVVHRDIKPENIFIARAQRAGGADFTVKLLDFGIAKIAAEVGTRSTRGSVGSPLWMAPEQTQPGPVSPAADVWALGLLAYELFTARSFWRTAHATDGTTVQLLREIVIDPLPSATARAREYGVESKLPAGFDAWFARCTCRDPASRFPDAGAAWRAMAALGAPSVRVVDDGAAFAETSAAIDARVPSPASPASPPSPPSPPVEPIGPIGSAPPPSGGPAVVTPAISAPPPRSPLGETPGVAMRDLTPAVTHGARPRRSGVSMLIGIALGGAVVAGAVVLARVGSRDRDTPNVRVSTTASTPSASTSEKAAASPASPPPAEVASPSPSPSPSLTTSSSSRGAPSLLPASSKASPPKKGLVAGGFGDPNGIDGSPRATMKKVQGRQVRLLTRLTSNASNVADAVVKKAIEWNAWQYLLCYERHFGGAKDMLEGTVVISFDILEQLPRHAQVESTTFPQDGSKGIAECVRGTLLGQTINAAGPEGSGRASQAFRFVLLD